MRGNPKVSPAQRQILSRFAADMQESGCDAVVIIASSTKKNMTRSFVAQFGNELLCNSLIHHAFHTETIVYTDEEIEEENDQ
tara:strand:- start:1104 stop:1349 length:246 start_codon:yes stop_codon:yes gene_type:complete